MHGEMLTYGLKNETTNELLHIDKVPNGLDCDCVCPHCHHVLIARNGGLKREHHFAHYKGAECGKARMTALHMLAQNILAETKQVMLPEYKSRYNNTHPAKLKTFDRIVLEEVCRNEDSTRRPDCIGYNYSKGGNIWIEIYCRHKIDATKKAEIRKLQQYCIEIDFSDLLSTDYSVEDVKNRLLETSHREWICCPTWDDEEERLNAEAKARMLAKEVERKRDDDELRKMVAEERRERIEEGRKREEYRLRRQAEQRNRQIDVTYAPAYYTERGAEFKKPRIPFDKKDRIIQAVHGSSIDPKNENYSAELAKKYS